MRCESRVSIDLLQENVIIQSYCIVRKMVMTREETRQTLGVKIFQHTEVSYKRETVVP